LLRLPGYHSITPALLSKGNSDSAADPHAPTVFEAGLGDRFHNVFGGFSVHRGLVIPSHVGAVDLHVGTEPIGTAADIVQPILKIQSLDVRVGKADFIQSGQTLDRGC
jgi:hypothetical protein